MIDLTHNFFLVTHQMKNLITVLAALHLLLHAIIDDNKCHCKGVGCVQTGVSKDN